jgi:tetratricopeptide (TPR) repeat protein
MDTILFKALIQYENQRYQEAIDSYEKVLGKLDINKLNDSEKDIYAMEFVKFGLAYFEKKEPDKEMAKKKLNVAKSLFNSLEDKEKVDAKIQIIDQMTAGSPPAESDHAGLPENSTITSNLTRPVNGLDFALS